MAPLLLKAIYVDSIIAHYTGIRFIVFIQVIANDALLYSLILALLLIAFLKKTPHFLAIFLRVAVTLLLTLYIVDFLILLHFNTHLIINDALKYATYSQNYVQQIYGIAGFIVEAVIIALVMLFIFNGYKIKTGQLPKMPLLIFIALPLSSALIDNELYAHSWVYRNVIDYNLMIASEASPYSGQFISKIDNSAPSTCVAKNPDPKNIIILMVESLSSYQSRFFSGIMDWTPHIDAIAEQNLAYKNFFANGFTTEDGEIALLTGIHPIYPPSSYNDNGGTSFRGFYDIEHSLPKLLKTQGYNSDFITTADLDFANTGVWARSIGFDYIEGHEHPFYDKWLRFHFKSAPDEALYQRAIDRIKAHGKDRFLLFIKTVSSHHPYINPETQTKSKAETFSYVDRQIGLFYNQLLEMGFFDQGLLVIVGDHHSMTPLIKAEVDLFGHYKASTQVPMIIANGGKQNAVEYRPFQQIDIFNGLQSLPLSEQCHSDWMGSLLMTGNQAARYIIHRRGDNRSIVSIFATDRNYLIKLDGDDTRLLKDTLAKDVAETTALLVNKVNALRVQRKSLRIKTKAD
jgi:lipoteichoic acid synthase